jgi:hypothetical protein
MRVLCIVNSPFGPTGRRWVLSQLGSKPLICERSLDAVVHGVLLEKEDARFLFQKYTGFCFYDISFQEAKDLAEFFNPLNPDKSIIFWFSVQVPSLIRKIQQDLEQEFDEDEFKIINQSRLNRKKLMLG